jgi:hypothetical protein
MIATTQMEATFCRAYNASKASRLGLRITIADCAGEPFKLMKVILDGLAQNSEAAFWLTNLQHSPRIVRIFPLDFAYLDADLNILQAAELPPGVPLPKFHPQAASALILPLGYLAANNSAEGDRLIIASEEQFDLRIAELRREPEKASGLTTDFEEPTDAGPLDSPAPLAQSFEPAPSIAAQTTFPIQSPVLGPGSGFTLALSSTWQVATATAPLVLGSDESQSAIAALEPQDSEVPPDDAALQSSAETGESPQTTQLLEAPKAPSSAIDLTQIALHERALAKIGVQGRPTAEPSVSLPDLQPASPVLGATEELIARSKKAAESSYVKVSAPPPPAAAKARKKSAIQNQQKKEHLGNKVVRWLALDEPLPERRKIIRLLLQGLQAYEANGDSTKRYKVRDVSPPGLYIYTDQPWKQGDLISLVLVKEGATNKDSEHRVSIQARVVRRDSEGAGVAFVFPEGTEFQPWQRAKTKRSDESEVDFILRELRLARALGFLHRLCPWSANEVNHALLERLSNKRVTSAVEIALQAESLLLSRGHVAQPFVASEIIVRIIEGGSWIDEDWIRRMWAGLLVSSCSADGQDRSNLQFIDLLARLTPIHLRIFSFVCHRAVEALAAGESEAALNLYSTAAELMEAADSHSFPRIQQTIGQLASVGLLAETARSSYVDMSDRSKTRTVPTSLGLRMFARCNGHQS